MNLFAKLSATEEGEFRKWARDNYVPGSLIKQTLHPVVQAECHLMNVDHLKGEYDLILDSDPRSDSQILSFAEVEIEEKRAPETII